MAVRVLLAGLIAAALGAALLATNRFESEGAFLTTTGLVVLLVGVWRLRRSR
ncbi:MAG: hypothetical protein ABR925_02040 [Acidimicrobiales bacterium]